MQDISVDGYPSSKPLTLFYRDPLECIHALLQNPVFEGKWDFTPRKVYDGPDRRNRIYNEWMTSDGAWAAQVGRLRCSHGARLILASLLSLQVQHYSELHSPLTRRTSPL